MEYVSRSSLHVDTKLLFSNARLNLNNDARTIPSLEDKDDIISTFRIFRFSRKHNTFCLIKSE